jgi:alpha-glucosidase
VGCSEPAAAGLETTVPRGREQAECPPLHPLPRLELKLTIVLFLLAFAATHPCFAATNEPAAARPRIVLLDPPEKDFFSKQLDFQGIPIKAHKVVVDDALYAAHDRLSMMLSNLPMVVSNLTASGVELHIIGRDQVTTDLPEWRHDKGKPIWEPTYNGMTRDQRTRGMGGRLTSCGEENLLKLEKDKYRGRDICLHEFAHSVRNFGLPREVRGRFDAQYRRSLEQGRWVKSYAGSNPDEFFAELTMWYFGTHGDLNMTGPKPENGPEGLKKYDPEAFALFDDFYRGRIPVGKVDRRRDWSEQDDDG